MPAATASAQVLFYFSSSARVVAMGDAGVADNSTPSTIVLNPANVIGAPRLYAQGNEVTFDPLDDDFSWRRANAGTALHLGSATLGLDVSYSRLRLTTGADVSTFIEDRTEELLALTAGVGFVAGNNDFLLGTTVKRFTASEDVSPVLAPGTESDDADAVAFDAGFEFRNRAALQGWDVNSAFGVSLIDAGDSFEINDSYQELPQHWTTGLNVRMTSPTIGVLSARVPLIAFVTSLDAMKPDKEDWEWMAGTELAVAQIFFLRSGIHTYTGSDNPDPSQATWGAGVGIPAGKMRARFDYGRESSFLGNIKHFELTLEWTL